MDDGLNCGRNVPGITRQTNALSFYSLGNEVDKERSRTASLIYKSIVIGIPDKFSCLSSRMCLPAFLKSTFLLYAPFLVYARKDTEAQESRIILK